MHSSISFHFNRERNKIVITRQSPRISHTAAQTSWAAFRGTSEPFAAFSEEPPPWVREGPKPISLSSLRKGSHPKKVTVRSPASEAERPARLRGNPKFNFFHSLSSYWLEENSPKLKLMGRYNPIFQTACVCFLFTVYPQPDIFCLCVEGALCSRVF